MNPNTATQYTEYAWTDRNGDRLWQAGEEGAVQAQFGGTANVSIDPNLRNSFTDELSAWVERELPGAIGARAGFVWKMDRDGYQQENANRPLSAWNVPITVTDPGPDGRANTGDDRPSSMLNLSADALAAARRERRLQPGGYEADYKSSSWRPPSASRTSGAWSARSSTPGPTSSARSYFGTGPAGSTGGTNPSLFASFASHRLPHHRPDDDTRNEFTLWNFKLHGTWEPAWGLRLTPVFRIQQGYPYGPRLQRHATSGVTGGPDVNYGTQPLRPSRSRAPQETIKQLDFRAREEVQALRPREAGRDVRRLQRVQREHRAEHPRPHGPARHQRDRRDIPTFGTPVTILPPRIARFSARLSF